MYLTKEAIFGIREAWLIKMLTLKEGGAKMKVRHVIWEDREYRGRLALKEERDIVTIKKLAGSNLPASYLFAILDAALPGWRQAAESLHLSRKHSWFIKIKEGKWGSLTFLLKVIRDVELLDIPTVATLHITCAGKLPEKIELWLGDLAPLAAALGRKFPQATLPPEEDEGYFPFWCDTPDGGYLKIRVEEPRFVGLDQGVMFPGEPSGLLGEPEQASPAQEEEKFQGGRLPEIEIV
jgi:hypothetical protein